VPGASIARVAREHGVNANQVFQWRCRSQATVEFALKREDLGGEFHKYLKTLKL
jgi:hypothetical protein